MNKSEIINERYLEFMYREGYRTLLRLIAPGGNQTLEERGERINSGLADSHEVTRITIK